MMASCGGVSNSSLCFYPTLQVLGSTLNLPSGAVGVKEVPPCSNRERQRTKRSGFTIYPWERICNFEWKSSEQAGDASSYRWYRIGHYLRGRRQCADKYLLLASVR